MYDELLGVPIGLLAWLLHSGLYFAIAFGLLLGLIAGLTTGMVYGLFYGLNAFAQHYTLRFWLWRTHRLPWDLVPFLDEAAERLPLRKVGGSYIFIHRLLLDYFATQNEPLSTESTSKSSKAQKQGVDFQ